MPDFGPLDQNSGTIFFLKKSDSLVTRYHGQQSSWTIPEKTNDLILGKLSDGRTEGQTERDGQTGRRTRVTSQERRASNNSNSKIE